MRPNCDQQLEQASICQDIKSAMEKSYPGDKIFGDKTPRDKTPSETLFPFKH